MQYNAWIRTLIEVFIDFYMGCIINFYSNDFDTPEKISSFVAAIVLVVLLSLIPILNLIFIIRKRYLLNSYKREYGVLFEAFRSDSIWSLIF